MSASSADRKRRRSGAQSRARRLRTIAWAGAGQPTTLAELKRGIGASIHVLSKLDNELGRIEPSRRDAIIARLQDPDLWDGKISLGDARVFYEIGSRWQNARDNNTKWDGTRDTFLGLSGNVGFSDAKVEQRQLEDLIRRMAEIRDGIRSGKYNDGNLQQVLDQLQRGKLGSYTLNEASQQIPMYEAIHAGNHQEAQRIAARLLEHFPDQVMAA